MRATAFGLLVTGLAFFAPRAANAQYFTFTTDFEPNPIVTTQVGNVVNISDTSNLTGLFAGAAGSDIQLANFTVDATSPTTGTWSTNVTETITLTPSNSSGIALPGDSPVSHTFDMDYSGAISNSSTASTLTIVPSAPQLYDFTDGSVFSVYIKSYSGPGG
jgi:hypothetical protein